MRMRTNSVLSVFAILAAVLPASADSPTDPLAAAGTVPVVTRTVTRDEPLRDPPLMTEREVFRNPTAYGNPAAPRPVRLRYETSSDWSGSFLKNVSFAANTDVLFTNGHRDAEIRIDIRRSSDVASVPDLLHAIFEKEKADGARMTRAYPTKTSNDEKAWFTSVLVTERGTRQVFFAVMRLPQQPQEYTVVIRAEWPKARQDMRRREMLQVMNSLTFE